MGRRPSEAKSDQREQILTGARQRGLGAAPRRPFFQKRFSPHILQS